MENIEVAGKPKIPFSQWMATGRLPKESTMWELSLFSVWCGTAVMSRKKKLESKVHVKLIWTEMNPLDPTYAIFLKSWGFKDVKYDIPMCQYHSTRPQPIQLVPTMQKKALYVIISAEIPEN